MRHVVLFSGGIGSWMAAKRVAQRHGTADMTLLFTDTLMEDSDLYRFLVDAACDAFGDRAPTQWLAWAQTLPQWHEDRVARRLQLETMRADAAEFVPGLVWIADGRDPWEVYRDERFLGNSQRDPCSKILKRRMSDRWLTENCDPADTIVYLGIDAWEKHRFDAARARQAKLGWRCEAPLLDPPINKVAMRAALADARIALPFLYQAGFDHNNCSGGCSKAGIGHWAHLLRVLPDRYAAFEAEEAGVIRHIGAPVSMLVDRRGGEKRPFTLRQLRERIEAEPQSAMLFEGEAWGGCGCMVDDADDLQEAA